MLTLTLRRRLAAVADVALPLAVAVFLVGWGIILVGAVALLSTAPLAAQPPPPPVNLGDTGLATVVRIWRFTEVSGTWSAADASGVTVSDLGTGEYQVGALPAATGTDRYRVEIALAAEPARALAGLTYGALPGSQVLYVPRLELPVLPLVFYAGDGSGTLGVRIRSGLPAAITDPGTTLTVSLYPPLGGAPVIAAAPAAITNTALDATTATWGATLAYAIQPGDLDVAAGDYTAVFTVTWPDASTRRLPAGSPLVVRILADPAGSP